MSVNSPDVNLVQTNTHEYDRKSERKVALATMIGTAIEFYDYFIYAAIAGMVFKHTFFSPAGESFAVILAFASVGISFLFRPLGAFIAGHYGDKLGRKTMLVLSLVLMGGSTTLIGLLPTYASIGLLAPALLIFLRILQGISAGGEWGGAILMAVEHAPEGKRGRFGSFPQLGVPLGLLLSSAVLVLMTGVISPGDAFLEWGWRIPFLLSIVLVVIGHWIRISLDETPVFKEIKKRKVETHTPIKNLFTQHFPILMLAALLLAGTQAVGYMTTGGFIQNYTTDPNGSIRMDRPTMLLVVTFAAFIWLIFTWLAGGWADKFGRKKIYYASYILQLITVFMLFPLVNHGTVFSIGLALVLLSISVGLACGVQSAFYSELFPASIRFSGVSIAYALGSILGGAFSPMIAAWLIAKTGESASVTYYLAAMTILSLVAITCLRDRKDIPLDPDHEALQRANPFSWQKD
ncbi:MFS transporter [Acinetobacter gerneri]|jgi:MFS family permease|uniref:Major facilitator superfamily (MFS) profile domain-containing protein n=1 Tax=Acinetobacter gerneri DSM 14967 = CIP 107464 = MTCC 9824 TaxID=1120926 RepID=N8YA79_9GAMM|nr:MFS transporter [Acinetobacter gerneri]ENV33702.1 hypothetical protein F960_02081 [Acinetobacter gerneri DSM 14967 = CIP 107464 = MTCC 9824]EPR82206.1 L-Proline/Glycine betaine transporter ProP [Acinetobacter gerneri DSM 14967 = CIP 107464 = MTCC 9824]MCH4243361.1 MHS family MFS transporter [Acinetobacter gerneri]